MCGIKLNSLYMVLLVFLFLLVFTYSLTADEIDDILNDLDQNTTTLEQTLNSSEELMELWNSNLMQSVENTENLLISVGNLKNSTTENWNSIQGSLNKQEENYQILRQQLENYNEIYQSLKKSQETIKQELNNLEQHSTALEQTIETIVFVGKTFFTIWVVRELVDIGVSIFMVLK